MSLGLKKSFSCGLKILGLKKVFLSALKVLVSKKSQSVIVLAVGDVLLKKMLSFGHCLNLGSLRVRNVKIFLTLFKCL